MMDETQGRGGGTVVSVYGYDDYHAFLREWMEARRKARSGFSFQVLANRAGLKSRSFLRLVSLGEKDLSQASAVKLATAMEMEPREADFFVALVGYNNATDPRERSIYFARLRTSKKPTTRRILSSQYFEFFSNWYIAPIWELVASVSFAGDFGKLASMLSPSITAEEARHALNVLLELDLVEPFGDKYAQKSRDLHTSERLVSRAIREYQAATIELARRALDHTPAEFRQINTLSLGLDAERWEKVKSAIREFRQRIVDIAAEVEAVDRVYQLNLQAFPLTKLPG